MRAKVLFFVCGFVACWLFRGSDNDIMCKVQCAPEAGKAYHTGVAPWCICNQAIIDHVDHGLGIPADDAEYDRIRK